MEFSSWVGKKTEYYDNVTHLPTAVAFCHAIQVQGMMTHPPMGMEK